MLIMENFHILVSIDDIRVTVGENPIEFMLIPAFGIWHLAFGVVSISFVTYTGQTQNARNQF